MFFTVKLTDSYKILMVALRLKTRDENGSDTAGYHGYYICFHISVRIRIRIWIVSTMPDRIRLDIDIINMRFEYSDTDMILDIEYQTRIRTDVNHSKRIQSRMWSENIRTVFTLLKTNPAI